MIDVRVILRADGMELTAVGHAGYAPRGQDVVCAGVSALLFGLVAYLEGLASAGAEGSRCVEREQGDGRLRVSTHGMAGKDIAAWAVASAGLRLVADAYPNRVAVLEKDER